MMTCDPKYDDKYFRAKIKKHTSLKYYRQYYNLDTALLLHSFFDYLVKSPIITEIL